MSHSLARKFDKIVSKLANKHKETKSNSNDSTENPEEFAVETSTDVHHESILQRMKGHLTHHHQQPRRPDGIPPSHVIIDDLKESPFRGKVSLIDWELHIASTIDRIQEISHLADVKNPSVVFYTNCAGQKDIVRV